MLAEFLVIYEETLDLEILSLEQEDARDLLLNEMDKLEAENARLQNELSEYKRDRERVLSETCFGDEKHCACVPDLRAENARLREASRWIPVSERMPEEKHSVDVLFIAFGRCFLGTHCFTENGEEIWWVHGSGEYFSKRYGNFYDVTHWMPLPEPPEVE